MGDTDSDTGLTVMATTSARDPLMPSPLPMLTLTPTTDTDTDADTDITDTDMEDTDMEDTVDTMVDTDTVTVWDTDVTTDGENKKLESTQPLSAKNCSIVGCI